MMNFGLKCSHTTRAVMASQKYKMIDLWKLMVIYITPRHILLIFHHQTHKGENKHIFSQQLEKS